MTASAQTPPPLAEVAPPPPPMPAPTPAPVAARPSVVTPAPEFSLFDPDRTYRLLDIGATGGFNNLGGIIGAEIDFRAFTPYLSGGLSGGTAAWGPRVSAHVRAYPFGCDVAGLFAEAAFSMNFGGISDTKVNGEVVERAEKLVTPVVHVGAGWRQSLNRWSWLLVRVGWGFKFTDDNVRYLIGSAEGPQGAVIALSQPGGFSIGLSAGFSIF
ncbi:MAG: hypothetical protein JNM17_21705 [Archangium sp.]|nr:hypothetical protein [Archangium sp.]